MASKKALNQETDKIAANKKGKVDKHSAHNSTLKTKARNLQKVG